MSVPYEEYKNAMTPGCVVDQDSKQLPKSNAKKVWDENYDLIISKRKSTCLKKYGVEYHTKLDSVKQKIKSTLEEHYGSIDESYKQRMEKTKQTKLERYGSETFHNIDQFKSTLNSRSDNFEKQNNCTKYNKLINQYGQGWKTLNIPIIYDGRFRYISNEYIEKIKRYSEGNHNLRSTSKLEQEVYDFVKSNTSYRCYRNAKNVISDSNQKYELDIYIPKLKIAIEFNGDYWHSTLYKSKYYHQIKTKLCYEKGILLIHIYEYDFIENKKDIFNNLIRLLNGKNCEHCGWIPVNMYDDYILTEPNLIILDKLKNNQIKIYDHGSFVKKY